MDHTGKGQKARYDHQVILDLIFLIHRPSTGSRLRSKSYGGQAGQAEYAACHVEAESKDGSALRFQE